MPEEFRDQSCKIGTGEPVVEDKEIQIVALTDSSFVKENIYTQVERQVAVHISVTVCN
jgi:hypothetical protein